MNATALLLGVIGGALIVIGANISAELSRRRREEALRAIIPPEGYRPEDF